LFKATIDRTEPADGLIIGFSDYPVLSGAYRTMLEGLYRAVPNIDPEKSAMVGFSNGAVAIAVLVSCHDEYILDRFHSFCMVDQGMFNLTDLYKAPTKDRRFLMLVGDKEALGRDEQIRGARLVEDMARLVGAHVETRILPNTGHELTKGCKTEIGDWVFGPRQ
jgi:predicted esterase